MTKTYKVKLNSHSLEFLKKNNIYSHPEKTINALGEGQVIYFNDDINIEPYVGFYIGLKNFYSIGSFSYTTSDFNHLQLKIGRYCSISWNCKISGMRHPIEHISTSVAFYHKTHSFIDSFIHAERVEYGNFTDMGPQRGAPVIGHDVWIGQDVTINQGIRIGNGSVIASGSVVTRDVDDFQIVGGNPAREIKKRFDTQTIDLINESEWWNYKFTDFNSLPISKPQDFARLFLDRKKDIEPYNPKKINMLEIPGLEET